MIELAELRAVVGIHDPAHVADDAFLLDIEARAVAYLESETRRYFGPPAPITEVLDGSGAQSLWLAETPAAAPALVLEARESDAWTAVSADDFTQEGPALYHDTEWRKGARLYRATYTRGYAAGEEPAEVRGAVLQLVHLWYTHRSDVAIGTVAAKIPHGVDRVIHAWRRYRV